VNTGLMKATCSLCGVPTPSAPDAECMCKVCRNSLARMRARNPTWIDEVVRRAIGSVPS
jgi:hypothetical protein